MMTEWPPDGYSSPEEYRSSELGVAGVGVAIGASLFAYLRTTLAQLADPLVAGLGQGLDQLGIDGWALALAWIGGGLMLTLLVLAGVGAFFRWVVVPVHERIHYEVNRLQGQNPEYIHTKFLFFENPSVINLSRWISAREYVPGALAPFVLIGLAALIAMQVTDGFLEALAAFVLVTNSAASGGDLYNATRVLLLPRGTLFANFKDGDEYRTEYAVPEEYN